MFVAQLFGALKIEFFGKAVDDHGENEAHERAKPDLVARRDNEIERHRPFVIYEVLNCKVAGRSRAAHKWIAIEGQCCFRCGQDAGEILVLLVEHFLNFLFHDGMSARWFAGRKPPVMGVVSVVWIVEKFAKGLTECEARACEEAGK